MPTHLVAPWRTSSRGVIVAGIAATVVLGASSCAVFGAGGTTPSPSGAPGQTGSPTPGECTGAAGNVRLWPGAPHPVDAANDLQIAIQYFLPGTSPRRVKLMLLGKGGTPTPAPPSSDGYDVGVGDRFTWGGATFEVRDICGTDVTLQLTKPSAAPS
jgi:hypothetical protein